ncbi:MAG: hypothetical protein E4H44_00140 [Candidatus Aminicenantes bacterium]|nr:MAG: hypothetical protein E4H44_00140 [Candidatus Aminicenantes bacterium]
MEIKECIDVKFSEVLGIFDPQCGYPMIDDQEDHSGPTGEVKNIHGKKPHAGKFLRGCKLNRIGILDYATRYVLLSTDTKTDQHLVEGRIFSDHGLPVDRLTMRLYSYNDKEGRET